MYGLPTTNTMFSRSKSLCEVQNHWQWLSSQHWICIFFQNTLNKCSQVYNQAADPDQPVKGKVMVSKSSMLLALGYLQYLCIYTQVSRRFMHPLHCSVQHRYICRFGRSKGSGRWCWKWSTGFQASSWDAEHAQQLKDRMEIIHPAPSLQEDRQWGLRLRKATSVGKSGGF